MIKLDPEFRNFLNGFADPRSSYQTDWLPRYAETVDRVKKSIESRQLDDAFELIWRMQDNSVANAGQGVLGFEHIDRLSDRLKQLIVEIAEDPSAATFRRISEKLAQWKTEQSLPKYPALLLARAFASIAPQKYHTTVDSRKHDLVIGWVEQHSNFQRPESDSWAVKAAALTEFLSKIDALQESALLRNMFPWHVYEQLERTTDGQPIFVPGVSEKPEEARARSSEGERQIVLRHNVLTRILIKMLDEEHGVGKAGADQRSGTGGWVDAILKHPNGQVWMYEIKVASTASLAIRQALGQLLEYGFQKGGWQPSNLIVVAEPELDPPTDVYLQILRRKFQLPIEYLQIKVDL